MQTYIFKSEIPELADGEILTASDGRVYVDGGQLNVVQGKYHFIYNKGWYMRNSKDNTDWYLGEGACPTAAYEDANVVDEERFSAIATEQTEDVEE